MSEPVPAPADGVLWRDVEGDITIFQPAGNSVHILNHTAAAVWQRLDGERSVDAIADELARQFQVNPSDVQDDVIATIERFRDAELLEGTERGWPRRSELCQLGGITIQLSATSNTEAERFCDLLPPIRPAEPDSIHVDHEYGVITSCEPGKWDLIHNGDVLLQSPDLNSLEKKLVGDLNRMARGDDQTLSVHSGAVALDGSIIAFPAKAEGGKSTIVAACIQRGFEYVTDEALLLDYRSGRVIPFQKPIQLDAKSMGMLGLVPPDDHPEGANAYLSARAVGGEAATTDAALRLSHVVLLEIETGAKPELSRLPKSQIVSSLLGAAFNHYMAPGQAFELVHQIADEADVWQLRLGDPREAAKLLLQQFS